MPGDRPELEPEPEPAKVVVVVVPVLLVLRHAIVCVFSWQDIKFYSIYLLDIEKQKTSQTDGG